MNVNQYVSLEGDGATQAEYDMEGDTCDITIFLERIKKRSAEKIAEFINEVYLTELMCAKSHAENACHCDSGKVKRCIFGKVARRSNKLLLSRFRTKLRNIFL